jgi:molybdate transport system substrate-binding protein
MPRHRCTPPRGTSRKWISIRRAAVLALALAGLARVPAAQQAPATGPLVFAAASLKNALDDVNERWRSERGKPAAVISYAASSALARQIEADAPADLFFSADLEWMDYLAERKRIRLDTRASLLGNRLVLIAPRGAGVELRIRSGFPLAATLGDGKLAIADTSAVPAGKYGKAALEALGVWDSVKDQVAQAENVRAALQLVARGEATLGVVYETDAGADSSVVIVDRFPADAHPPIVYPIALTATSSHPDAAAFLDYLTSAAARPSFEKQGFTVLPATRGVGARSTVPGAWPSAVPAPARP